MTITTADLPHQCVVVGTDTEIGKTHVACRILKQWQQQGINASEILAIKPLVSGSIESTSLTSLIWDDLERLKQTGCQTEYFYGFQPAISPDAAALLTNPITNLSVADLASKTEECIKNHEGSHVLIEGAGGVFLPLNDTESFLDLLIAIKLPVILVVGMKLGGINHALLTLEALLRRQIHVTAWVANYLPQYNCPFFMLERLQQRFMLHNIPQLLQLES